jgi:2-iminobutanoate/2-iminopropanoate deaminase
MMPNERVVIDAQGAPAAVGPYSHAVRSGELLFCSGQIPLDPSTGEIVGAGAAEQARRCLENLEAVCTAAGTSLSRALRLTVYMTDLGEFAPVNEVYASFFADGQPPARVAIGVLALPKGAQVEIDAIVAL